MESATKRLPTCRGTDWQSVHIFGRIGNPSHRGRAEWWPRPTARQGARPSDLAAARIATSAARGTLSDGMASCRVRSTSYRGFRLASPGAPASCGAGSECPAAFTPSAGFFAATFSRPSRYSSHLCRPSHSSLPFASPHCPCAPAILRGRRRRGGRLVRARPTRPVSSSARAAFFFADPAASSADAAAGGSTGSGSVSWDFVLASGLALGSLLPLAFSLDGSAASGAGWAFLCLSWPPEAGVGVRTSDRDRAAAATDPSSGGRSPARWRASRECRGWPRNPPRS